jgi:hypothetical protein
VAHLVAVLVQEEAAARVERRAPQVAQIRAVRVEEGAPLEERPEHRLPAHEVHGVAAGAAHPARVEQAGRGLQVVDEGGERLGRHLHHGGRLALPREEAHAVGLREVGERGSVRDPECQGPEAPGPRGRQGGIAGREPLRELLPMEVVEVDGREGLPGEGHRMPPGGRRRAPVPRQYTRAGAQTTAGGNGPRNPARWRDSSGSGDPPISPAREPARPSARRRSCAGATGPVG